MKKNEKRDNIKKRERIINKKCGNLKKKRQQQQEEERTRSSYDNNPNRVYFTSTSAQNSKTDCCVLQAAPKTSARDPEMHTGVCRPLEGGKTLDTMDHFLECFGDRVHVWDVAATQPHEPKVL